MATTRRIEVVVGDVARQPVDAVVNAANPALARGSGVCGAVFAAAGDGLVEACAALGGCATGDAVVTPGFELPARWIVHAVGPIWRGGDQGEAALLASAYERALEVAAAAGARSIAVPALSTGVYGFPPELAAPIAVRAVTGSPAPIERVLLVAWDDATAARYRALLGDGP